jgi:hypothetical protein
MKTRISIWLAAAALLAGAAVGQEKSTVPASAEAASTPAGKLAALIERFNKQQNDTNDAYSKAESQSEKDAIWAKRPGKEYIPEFRALAEEARGTDTAAQAWMWVLRLDNDPKKSWEVIELLLSEHMQSLALSDLPDKLRYASYGEAKVIEALRALVAESPHEKVRAGALFTLGSVLLESGKPESKTEGRDCMEAVVTEYGSHAFGNTTYKAAAEGFLFELDHLQIGMAAPDFESIDENGAKWRLSDYKGKVVIVDFWGNW